jgi:hypothetical protein
MLFGLLGTLPDFDLLVGDHRGLSHSLGAACVIGALVWGIRRTGAVQDLGRHLPLACMAAYASHIFLDWLGTDTSPPIGIMAFWPISGRYHESSLHLFSAISRRYEESWSFLHQNLFALARELAILLPVLALIMALRPRSRTR